MIEAKLNFYDAGLKSYETVDGFFVVNAVLIREDVLKYTYRVNGDIVVRHEYIPASELSKESAIESAKGAPFTLDHPDDSLVDSKNYKKEIAGSVFDVEFDPVKGLIGKIKVFDKNVIDKIKSGDLRELSIGYFCSYQDAPGVFENKTYDVIQKDLLINHLALVSEGRAGPSVKIVLNKGDCACLLYTSPSPRDRQKSRMPSSA